MSIRNVEIQTIGLHVGTPDHSKALPLQRKYTKSGIFTCAGTSIFGDCEDRGGVATVTIGTADSTSVQADRNLSLFVSGNTILNGDDKTKYGLEVFGGSSMPLYVGGSAIVTGNLTISGTMKAGFATWSSSIVATSKLFDIEHPLKGKGHRLAHASLEGPEIGVYYRGTLKDSEFIELPDYWKDLVDTKTITVHLTPIGTYQYLYYTVAKNRIIVKNHSNLPTHCSYIVYGERKDGERLIPEYEGNTPEDYPGKNDQYSIAGYHYDRRTL